LGAEDEGAEHNDFWAYIIDMLFLERGGGLSRCVKRAVQAPGECKAGIERVKYARGESQHLYWKGGTGDDCLSCSSRRGKERGGGGDESGEVGCWTWRRSVS
jgi:hypothetical protein